MNRQATGGRGQEPGEEGGEENTPREGGPEPSRPVKRRSSRVPARERSVAVTEQRDDTKGGRGQQKRQRRGGRKDGRC